LFCASDALGPFVLIVTVTVVVDIPMECLGSRHIDNAIVAKSTEQHGDLLMDSRAYDIRDSINEIVSRFLSTPFQDNQDLTVVIDVANF
jgi:hypothetical protein